ncbi:Hypothetical predicted protein [Olea europaea subsp. europaea]|uniref:Uncharacterized protein n=1 Tax=Olea europaea subsp. europaea TaxID=158383 RepID=A0A8S0VPC2_OLEEU|nr:Hypothetical predicted protein [Olea europaea subsp. europaea]
MAGSTYRGDLGFFMNSSQGPSIPRSDDTPTLPFSLTELFLPAVLLRILLLRAGIESNPGPSV